ncbi:hypothetical protein [Mycobacterium sp. UM_WGJ]|uniref:hypothetical protein n=1 Tax=Mycobacterium sp. UM_WGJ TaxID=1370120 RepID=UPI000463DC7B|nr:hypothetical protein [Mycobacterium sp. UM_WGJ]
MAKKVLGVALAVFGLLGAPAHADPPVAHEVVYTVTTRSPVVADIYYRDTEPPTWADYSHNPYEFSPKVRVEVGPSHPWVLHTSLTDPQRWAMVTATSGRSAAEPMFRCELTVDGVVVATADGPKGALCALRHW